MIIEATDGQLSAREEPDVVHDEDGDDQVGDKKEDGAADKEEETECLENAKSYQSRVGLLEFSRVVTHFQTTHKDMVTAMGFGGLLDLNLKVSRNGVAYELLRRFDVESSSLHVHGRRLQLREGHVSWILGLPYGGIEVSSMKFNKKEVCAKYSIKSSKLARKDLVQELLHTDLGERWVALFVMLAVDCVLHPSYTYYVSHDVLRVMSHCQNLKSINWSKFVIDGLVKGANKLAKSLEDLASAQKAYIPIHGCTILLELFYLEHAKTDRMLGLIKERRCPRVQAWTDAQARKALKWVKTKGGFDSDEIEVESYDDWEISTSGSEGGNAAQTRIDYVIQKLNEVIRGQNTIEEKVFAAITNLESKFDMLSSAVNSIGKAVQRSNRETSPISYVTSVGGSSVQTRGAIDLNVNSDDIFGVDDDTRRKDVPRGSNERTSASLSAGKSPNFDNMHYVLEEMTTPTTAAVTSISKKRVLHVDDNMSKPLRRSTRRLQRLDDEEVIFITG